MRINNAGQYEHCRWAVKPNGPTAAGLATEHPITWFKSGPAAVRTQLLDGQRPTECSECANVDSYQKVSGRAKQLLKAGIRLDHFDQTLNVSPWRDAFVYSANNNGTTDQWPQDWQIDLGNYCNSACVFCYPEWSSKIASEYVRIGLASTMPAQSWTADPAAVSKVASVLASSPNLAYLHFIGGETLITPAFEQILQALVDSGVASTTVIGFTTNLTVWRESTVQLLVKFKQVHVGLSVECFTALNDYVRYGSKIETVTELAKQWIGLAKQHDWYVQLRVTPTILTIGYLHTVYEFAFAHGVAVESCNFLEDPVCMRISVLPFAQRATAISSLQRWIDANPVTGPTAVANANTRNPGNVHAQLVADAASYVTYLSTAEDTSDQLPSLVAMLTALERSRGNRILDYLPEYEQIFATAGYKPNA